MTTAQIIFGLLVAIVAAAGSYGAARYAGKSSVKVKEIDVKAEAYQGAQAISKEGMEWLREQIAEVKQEHRELKQEHDQLKTEHGDLKESHRLQGEELRQVKENTQQVTQDLEISVNWFEQFLIWEHSGSRPPRPHIPEALRKYFSQNLLNDQQLQQERFDNLSD